MMQGFYAGISGLQTNQYGLDVIADNLANIDTVGFKSSSAEFADLFSKVISSNSKTPTHDDIGYGTSLKATNFDFSQGAMLETGNYTDLAIDGNGWFAVTGLNNQIYFTRNGQFHFDAIQPVEGDVNSSTSRLIDPSRMIVQGTISSNFSYDSTYDYGDKISNGVTGAYILSEASMEVPMADAGSQGALEFPTRLAYPAAPTSTASFYGNLGIDDAVRTMSTTVISPNGDKNILSLTFAKNETQPESGSSWNISAVLTSPDGTITYDTQEGQATFDGTGAMTGYALSAVNNDGAPVAINLGSGLSGITANQYAISSSSQIDGLEKGLLTKYHIDSDGVIIADFSNGKQSAIGQVAVFHFQNDQGLNRDGGTYYTETTNSGKPLFWSDANGNYTTGSNIRSGFIEASNVRVEVGMTDMIITQRAYQASGKVLTTVDEMIQKALQMHR